MGKYGYSIWYQYLDGTRSQGQSPVLPQSRHGQAWPFLRGTFATFLVVAPRQVGGMLSLATRHAGNMDLFGMLITSHEDTRIHHMIFGKQNESLPAAQNGCSMFSRSFLKHDMGWQDSYLVSFMDFKSQDCREKPQWKATVAFEEQAMERYLHKSYKSAVGSVIPRIPVSKTRM